ncbi:uncharacterized protein BJX67DRAFT_384037 [Aspergillus lucknowensis]|uniref:Uncharacterized protein n=1 Tax=Aspergillus lucknowensis TaxID=176173 RepID=A0ABR4LI37_9EURO
MDGQHAAPQISIEGHLESMQDAAACDNLSKAYHKRFQKESKPELLDAAILCARRTVELCSAENPRLPRYCFRVANYLDSRHRRSNSPDDDDLDEALEYLELATERAQSAGETAREKAARLGVASDCHFRLYMAGRDGEYGEAAHASDAVLKAWMEIGDGDKIAAVIHDIGTLHWEKYDRDDEKDLELLDLPVQYADKAIEAAGETGGRPRRLLHSKIGFLDRRAANNETKSQEDYRTAIATCKTILSEDFDSEDDPEGAYAIYQAWLGRLYLRLGQITGSKNDYHEAAYNLQRASEAIPRDHPEWKSRFDLFQFALEESLVMHGLPPGLNGAVYAQEKIVENILASEKEEDQGEPQAEALYKLALLQQARYNQRHTIDDLISETENLEKAVLKTPETDYEKLLGRLGLASECYEILYQDEGDPKYLRLGIQTAQKAVEREKNAENVSKWKKAPIYGVLGRCMAALSEEDDDPGLMRNAVEAVEAALTLVGTEDQIDEDDRHRRERQRYLDDLEDWRNSIEG